jgi:hypothetical protein
MKQQADNNLDLPGNPITIADTTNQLFSIPHECLFAQLYGRNDLWLAPWLLKESLRGRKAGFISIAHSKSEEK